MIFKHKDGEFRILDNNGTTTQPYYIEVLFTGADLSFPIAKPRPEEILNMDRSNFDSNSSYSLGADDPILEPQSFTITAKLDDTVNSTYLKQWVSGVTSINSHTLLTAKSTSQIYNGIGSKVTTPAFKDTRKMAYNVEVLWDGSTDLGYKLCEVYFPPASQTISEAEDAVTISINGMIYGAIKTITSFTSGKKIQNA